jgi:hypothetical protein
MVVALVLLVLSWSWLAVAMRAGADVSAAAVRLLGATPLDAGRARAASLRYPLIAVACTLVPVVVVATSGGRGAIALVWVACEGAASAWPLVRIFRATRNQETPA